MDQHGVPAKTDKDFITVAFVYFSFRLSNLTDPVDFHSGSPILRTRCIFIPALLFNGPGVSYLFRLSNFTDPVGLIFPAIQSYGRPGHCFFPGYPYRHEEKSVRSHSSSVLHLGIYSKFSYLSKNVYNICVFNICVHNIWVDNI